MRYATRLDYATFARMVDEMQPAGDLMVNVVGGYADVPCISLERLNSDTLKEANESPIVLSFDFRTKEEMAGAKKFSPKGVEIAPFGGIFWDIHAEPLGYVEEEELELVQLQWGWTAGCSQEFVSSLADDSPSGFDSLTITMEVVRDLRDRLNQILEASDANGSSDGEREPA